MKVKFVVVVGNLSEGIDIYGPFPDRTSAQVWSDHRGLRIKPGKDPEPIAVCYVMPLYEPLDS